MAGRDSVRIELPKLLVVEEADEANFFRAALENHLRLNDIQILAIGGKTKLSQNLAALALDPNLRTVTGLAIVRDADSDARAAFESVSNALAANALPRPIAHAAFVPGPPRVGVFVMPNGTDPGMLESLCLNSVAGTAEYRCVAAYFDCLQPVAASNNPHKAWAHAWLASRPEPDKRVGEAALKGYWPFGDPVFESLWAFVRGI